MLFLTGHQFMHANSSWWPVIRSMHDIYFSGHLIFSAILDALDQEGLKDADTVVLAGLSPGAPRLR